MRVNGSTPHTDGAHSADECTPPSTPSCVSAPDVLAVVLRRQGGGPGRQKYDELNTSVSDTTGLLPMSDSPAAPLPDFLKSGGEHDPLAAAMKSTRRARQASVSVGKVQDQTALAGKV